MIQAEVVVALIIATIHDNDPFSSSDDDIDDYDAFQCVAYS